MLARAQENTENHSEISLERTAVRLVGVVFSGREIVKSCNTVDITLTWLLHDVPEAYFAENELIVDDLASINRLTSRDLAGDFFRRSNSVLVIKLEKKHRLVDYAHQLIDADEEEMTIMTSGLSLQQDDEKKKETEEMKKQVDEKEKKAMGAKK